MPTLQEQFDKSNLHEIISNLPKQFTQAFDAVDAKISAETKKIIFCGMGGSALPANLLKTFFSVTKSNFNIPIKISRDYSLPHLIDENWCGFFDSYSGNTEETLSALAEAEQKGMKQIVILAHTGKLKEIAAKKNYTFIEIPDTGQPRLAYGYTIGALLKLFHNSGLNQLDFNQFNEEISQCLSISSTLEEKGKALAESVKGKIPVVYCSNIWKYVAMVWKINFNENAKTQSFWNVFPELNHNEMVGYTNLVGNYKIIILKDSSDHEQNQKRMAIFKKLLGDKIDIEIIDLLGDTPFEKMLSRLLLGLWTSYYLALLYGVDPAPVDLVEAFKLKLSNV